MATRPVTRFRTNALYPPGEYLAEELAARGMTQVALVQAMNRPIQVVNAIIRGRKTVTAETAIQLEKALGIEAEFWLNLEMHYQLAKVRQAE
ncbi:MAG: HigA family addiction module antidote protein [Chloroflexi bacterium]|nr:HigA family addiction module antidote protein [Chloroflexota bacterium]